MAAPELVRRVSGGVRRRLRRPGPPVWFPAVEGRIHPHDDMRDPRDTSAAHYAKVGQSALEEIGGALEAAGRSFGEIGSCLDMPSGYGRVLRLLSREMPAAQITACDVNREAIRFCASELGAVPLRSRGRLETLRLGRYDLIWCGSLITHLDDRRTEQLLRQFADALMPGGVAVVTVHGDPPDESDPSYGPLARPVRAALASRGSFHVAYVGALDDYGHAWHTKEYVSGVFDRVSGGAVELVSFGRRGWDEHQDVLGFQRRPGEISPVS